MTPYSGMDVGANLNHTLLQSRSRLEYVSRSLRCRFLAERILWVLDPFLRWCGTFFWCDQWDCGFRLSFLPMHYSLSVTVGTMALPIFCMCDVDHFYSSMSFSFSPYLPSGLQIDSNFSYAPCSYTLLCSTSYILHAWHLGFWTREFYLHNIHWN